MNIHSSEHDPSCGADMENEGIRRNCPVVEVHLRELNQLFDAMDPSPFRERDLSPAVEDYIVESVKESPSGPLYGLVIYLDQPSSQSEDDHLIGEAVRRHFARRSRILSRDLRRMIRRGLISLGIGVGFLVTLFIIARGVQRAMGESGAGALLRESMLIAGWVAMWRPLEIFLYDWWPLVGERRVHDRLSRIAVQVLHK